MNTQKKSAITTFIIGLSCLLAISCGKTEQKNGQDAEPNGQAQVLNEDTTQTEKLYVEMDVEAIPSLKKGDTFQIKMADSEGEEMNLQIRRIQETIPGITSVSALVENSEKGQATLTVKGQKVTGIIDLFDQKKKYTFGYDSTMNSYYLSLMNPEDMDILPGSAPVTPNEEGN
ncbi:hypothetical protein [Gracilimonas sp.]|uniref:hypothetical protein n=1 Tax=Gracilimonas sp. TaxID=1974203 RepID=UPI003D0F90C2